MVGAPGASAVPAGKRRRRAANAVAVFAGYRDDDWIVNSRNTADEDVVRTLASMAGFAPRVVHRADSLDLLEDLIVAGLGVGLLPLDRPVAPGRAAAAPERPRRPPARVRRHPSRSGGLASARPAR